LDVIIDLEGRALFNIYRKAGDFGGAAKLRCVSAYASWTPMKNEYLCVSHRPDMAAAGRTEKSNAPNEGYKKL